MPTSTLFITECSGGANTGSVGLLEAILMPPLAEQHVQIGGASVTSAAFQANTTTLIVNCDVACCLAWGNTATPPVANANSQRMSAGETRHYGVPKGQGYYLAVIASTD